MRSIKLGNVAIDGEVEGKGWKMALELKTPMDDVTRGIGQLSEAKISSSSIEAQSVTRGTPRNVA
jgi:hypothetical protein